MNSYLVFNRFLPNQKKQQRVAEKGLENEAPAMLPLVGIRRDERVVARLLPPVFADLQPGWDFGLLLSAHKWGLGPSQARAACPLETHPPLLQRAKMKIKKCPACEAVVLLNSNLVVHAALNDKRGGVALKLDLRDHETITRIIEDGCLGFKDGCLVELWREGWELHYEALKDDPVEEEEFRPWLAGVGIDIRPYPIKAETLQFMADAVAGWQQAGEPQPQPGQHQELARLMPQATLLDIPFGFKAPQRFRWNETPRSLMTDPDYLHSLDLGNIGLLCGKVQEFTYQPTVKVIVGLDADTDDFAAELEVLNTWLNSTFSVRGARGRKWFFLIEGRPRVAEACAHSTKIKRGDKDVGDWLGNGKQGVVLGLHPSGCFYEHNGLPLATIAPAEFALPGDCRFARTGATQPVLKGGGWMSRRANRPVGSLRVIRSALNCIPPHERDVWFTIGCALKTWGIETGDDDVARQLFDEWSAQSSKFDVAGQEKLWGSLSSRSNGVITLGSLFFLAHNNGWRTNDDDGKSQ